jgi:hypothetical protein
MFEVKVLRNRSVLILLIVAIAAIGACAWAWARSTTGASRVSAVVLQIDARQRGHYFAAGSVGLSMGSQELSAGHLTAENGRLVRLLRLLGSSVLRIGGNRVDVSWWTSADEAAPTWATNTVTPKDLAALRVLLMVTGWRVLLGLDLGHFEPTRAAEEARYAQRIIGPYLLGVEIGNEPDEFRNTKIGLRPSTYTVDEYRHEAEAYKQAIDAAAPGVSIYGPAMSGTQWLTDLGAGANIFTDITQHYYATSTCPRAPLSKPQPTATGLLSLAVRQDENEVLEVLARAGATAGRPTRIGETNSVSCNGSVSASPVFASALWALDWTLRAENSGVTGLNFHGWLGVCGISSYSPICASSPQASQSGDITAQSEYYGLLAARQLEGGWFVPTRLSAPMSTSNLTTWATVYPDGTIKVAIDNFATAGRSQQVSISASGYAASEESLVGPSIESKSGINLGTVQVSNEGKWRPRLVDLRRARRFIQVGVRPASAVIVILRPRRSHS